MRCAYIAHMRQLRCNLLDVYAQRTRADYEAGIAWYPNAHRIVCEWADAYERPIANVACVVAALSPQCSWERNLVIADDILALRRPSIGGALPANIRKAQRIRDDRACTIADYFPFGYKVNTFAANLAGNWSVATVDTHGLQAALNDVRSTLTLRRASYDVFSQCYVDAASAVGLEPAHFQAIVWHVWRRLYPWGRKQKLRQQWYTVGELEG